MNYLITLNNERAFIIKEKMSLDELQTLIENNKSLIFNTLDSFGNSSEKVLIVCDKINMIEERK